MKNMKLTRKIVRNDLLLLAQLRTDARQSVLALSDTVDLCRITVAKRLSVLRQHVIQKYTALLDFQQLGFSVRVQLNAHPVQEDCSIFERFIRQQECLNNLYVASQGTAYIADLLFQTNTEADVFLSRLDSAFSFIEKHVYFINQELVREHFFSQLEVPLCN